MKINRVFCCVFAFTVIYLGAISIGSAQIYAKDDAANYGSSPGNSAWVTGASSTNGGFGFNPWVFTRGGSGFQGFFLGNGDAVGSTNGNYWGMYANSGSGDNVAVAYRGFTNSLQTNTVFKIKWHTLGIGFDASHRGGFSLRNGNVNATTNDFDTGTRFDFYYIGGGVDSYLFADGNGVNTTGLGFGQGPFQIEFTLLTPDTYRLVIKDVSGANTLGTFDNQTLAGSGTIDSVALYALQTDGNQNFNSLEISSTSLVPPDIQNVNPTNGSIYVDASTASVNFDVVSLFSTVATNGITLNLNGINQTNITVTGFGTNRHVVLNSALLGNFVYNGTIVAQDANGNRATNRFTFNTWRPDNPFIEAEDYNFTGGHFISPSFPDGFNNYAYLMGSNGVDYLEYDLSGANNIYRPGDLPQVEPASDADHAGYAGFGYADYNLAFIENGEWENYTRVMTNAVYDVYARMAGFGNSATMSLEHLANPTATTSNQPAASLGTFVCPNTGGAQNWTFVQLKNLFSNPVQVRFAGTNTFRTTCLGADGNYNFSYLIFVPNTNTAILRPYLASGFPFPGAGNVSPDQKVSFTIANREAAVTPASIQIFLNDSNITSFAALSNNAAGSLVSYQPQFPNLLPAGTNTLQAIFTDGSVSQTNQWQFTVAAVPVIPTSYAVPINQAGSPGFGIQIAKADDTAPAADFPPTIARAVLHLAGQITNGVTGQPYPNLAAGPNNDGLFDEPDFINYDINATPSGNSTFSFKTNFPYVPANAVNNYISMAANMYVQLSAGLNTFAVRSDDGFLLAAGPALGGTNLYLGLFDGGRGDNTPTTFSFIVQTNGLYPMRLIYDQGEFGGNIELYSTTGGQNILLNDLSNVSAVKVYRSLASTSIMLLNPAHAGNISTFNFQTQSGQNYTVQFKTNLIIGNWLTLQSVAGTGSATNITDNTATNAARFYRVTSP